MRKRFRVILTSLLCVVLAGAASMTVCAKKVVSQGPLENGEKRETTVQELTQDESLVQMEEILEDTLKDTLYISDAETFLEFAESCRLDSYSRNLPVVLTADIDLTGMDFQGIPIFCGDFDGGNHTISGLYLTVEGSVQGLFRYIAKGAVVHNLVVKGEVLPEGSRCTVGGIAGNNAGCIENCNFWGHVAGAESIGGLVGINEMTGVVDNCRMKGIVYGTHFVGGIAGENYGVIRNSTGLAEVNTTVEQNRVELSDITLETLTGTESSTTVTDIGGIAGANVGVIRSCVNQGAVGYCKMGYNIGGIAGNQNGYIVDCVNYADVFGRKEVGGIVGHMEPNILLEFTEDTLQILDNQFHSLEATADRATVNAKGSASTLKKQTETLKSQMEDARTALDELSDEDSIVAVQNNLSSGINDISETLQGMNDTNKDALNSFRNSLNSMKKQVNAIGNTMDNADEHLGGTITDISDWDTALDFTSKIQSCVNYGDVQADLNAGGIVGVIAPENDLDTEEDFDILGEQSLNFEGELRSVIWESENHGIINVSKQNAGGIVGRMDLGLVKDCLDTGAIVGENADYIGGICGQSCGYIRRCSAKCSLTGDSYVGGIAGKGKTVTDCRSMTQMQKGIEKLGTVLGVSAEDDADEAVTVSGNFYMSVGKDIGAIDGISYSGRAEPLEQAAFLALEGLEDIFRKVAVEFVFDSGATRTVYLELGEELKAEDIPEVPCKDGSSGYWENIDTVDFSEIRFDMSFEAVYNSKFATIQSGEMSEDNRPILLAQGEFAPGQTLVVTKSDTLPILQEEEAFVAGYAYAVEPAGTVSALRYLLQQECETENLKVLVYDEDSNWREVAFTEDGSYLVFSVEAGDTGFCLIEVMNKHAMIMWICLYAVIVFPLIIILCMKIGKS